MVGLKSLQILNIGYNQLHEIHYNAFIHLKNLKNADFSHNQLNLNTGVYDILGQVSPFNSNFELVELHLSHNNISAMHTDWIILLNKLKILDLKYNAFNYLEVNIFKRKKPKKLSAFCFMIISTGDKVGNFVRKRFLHNLLY